MRAVRYALHEGWLSLWRSRASGTFAVLAIALAMLVLGTLLLLTSNIERVIARWTTAAEFSVYLRDDATSEQRGAIETSIDRSGVSAGREYVSKAQALARFRKEFADLAPIADGFDDNPFPASLEVRVRPDADRDGRATSAVATLLRMPGVADVRYDREWLTRLTAVLDTLRGGGLALVALMALAAAVTVASVVRLGLYARRDELEVMQLVGSPIVYIRGPFVAEGVMQGGLGALVALLLLWLGFALAMVWWGGAVAGILDGNALEFLPARLSAMVVVGGMAVGAVGGFAASRHAV
jgi:cell division transport system permease protein